jgi:hypothetical protein
MSNGNWTQNYKLKDEIWNWNKMDVSPIQAVPHSVFWGLWKEKVFFSTKEGSYFWDLGKIMTSLLIIIVVLKLNHIQRTCEKKEALAISHNYFSFDYIENKWNKANILYEIRVFRHPKYLSLIYLPIVKLVSVGGKDV